MNLPGILGEIAEIAGEAAALKVAREKGGTRAYFPANPGPSCWLVQAVGQDVAVKICGALVAGTSGITLDIPLGPMGSRAQIWHTMRKGFAEGAKNAEIARRAGVDLRTVRRHRNGHNGVGPKKDDDQGSLF